MSFIVVYDACVLHPAPLRDLLVRLAMTGLFRAKWTEQILDECFESILRERPDLSPERLLNTRTLMQEAIPDCLVKGYQEFIEPLCLPDPEDRHVLAAAIRSGAQVIVTQNLKDFPESALSQYDIEAQHPDQFVVNVIDLDPGKVCEVVREQAAELKRPPCSSEQLLDTLEKQGLPEAVALLRPWFKRDG